jgi:hypothetical protein
MTANNMSSEAAQQQHGNRYAIIERLTRDYCVRRGGGGEASGGGGGSAGGEMGGGGRICSLRIFCAFLLVAITPKGLLWLTMDDGYDGTASTVATKLRTRTDTEIGVDGPSTTLSRCHVTTDAVTMLLDHNKPIGYVSRICPRIPNASRQRSKETTIPSPQGLAADVERELLTNSHCWLFDPIIPSGSSPSSTMSCNNNGPMPVKRRGWMHPSLTTRHNKLLLYYSSHSKRKGGGNDIELLVASNETDTWRVPGTTITMTTTNGSSSATTTTTTTALHLSFPPPRTEENKNHPNVLPCASVHSPSIYVDDQNRVMYMYVFLFSHYPLLLFICLLQYATFGFAVCIKSACFAAGYHDARV